MITCTSILLTRVPRKGSQCMNILEISIWQFKGSRTGSRHLPTFTQMKTQTRFNRRVLGTDFMDTRTALQLLSVSFFF